MFEPTEQLEFTSIVIAQMKCVDDIRSKKLICPNACTTREFKFRLNKMRLLFALASLALAFADEEANSQKRRAAAKALKRTMKSRRMATSGRRLDHNPSPQNGPWVTDVCVPATAESLKSNHRSTVEVGPMFIYDGICNEPTHDKHECCMDHTKRVPFPGIPP